jgi:uncharacterized damage-inducible protein DinB
MLGTVAVTHLRFNQWATGQILDETVPLPAEQLVKNLGGSFSNVYNTLVHLYRADCIWYDRLNAVPTGPLDAYEAPGCTYDLQTAWTALLAKTLAWGESQAEDDWHIERSYKTLAGVPIISPQWQMVLHLVNHGTHHRGQITHMLRQLGAKPVNLDLIGFYRRAASVEVSKS